MAQTLPCDVCQDEPAVMMMTNLGDGTVIAVGGHCAPVFSGQLAATTMGIGEHAGPPTKCQTCRRFHERMTTPVAPIGIPDQAPDDAAQAADDAAQAADAP
jgi:hypothetical protein